MYPQSNPFRSVDDTRPLAELRQELANLQEQLERKRLRDQIEEVRRQLDPFPRPAYTLSVVDVLSKGDLRAVDLSDPSSWVTLKPSGCGQCSEGCCNAR